MKISLKSLIPKTKKAMVFSYARRTFLKAGAAVGIGSGVALVFGGGGKGSIGGVKKVEASPDQPPRGAYWREGGYFVHDNVDASRWKDGIIRAKTDGQWREYLIRNLDSGFVNWNLNARLDVLSGGMMCLDGPHSAALATYGANRGDSNFTINNAFKGFGFIPTERDIDAAIDAVTSNWYAEMSTKITILRNFYSSFDMWDTRLLGSLELYSSRAFETHSFLNQMANPQVSIVWLSIPGSYEVRAIPRLIHPDDPEVPEDDYKRIRWINMIHDFFHGGPYPERPTKIAAIYYVIEEFDNSPMPGPMGVRQVPPL